MTNRNRWTIPAVLVCAAMAPSARAQGFLQTQPAQPTTGVGQPAAAQPTATGLTAGGLAPPSPLATGPAQQTGTPQGSTETKLRKAEQEDSGRGLEWFYLNVEGGYQVLGLETVSASNLSYGTSKTKDAGPMIGAGMGIRLLFLTIGARARMGMFEQYKATTLNAEVGLHLPIGSVEPYFALGGGYAFLGSLDSARWGSSDVSVRGWDVRAGFGLDYYVTPVFSIGGNLTGEMLGLSRPGVKLSTAASQPGGLDPAAQAIAKADGSSIGASVTASAVLGLHF